MKVLLAQPVSGLLEPSVHIRMCYVEPLGIESICSATRAAGHKCTIAYPVVDTQTLGRILEEEKPSVLGISIYTYAIHEAVQWAKVARALFPEIRIVAGGHHPTAMPEQFLCEGFDYVVIGEGESTFAELLSYIELGENGPIPPGVATIREGAVECGTVRSRIKDLDILPPPDRIPAVLGQARNFQVIYPPPSQL